MKIPNYAPKLGATINVLLDGVSQPARVHHVGEPSADSRGMWWAMVHATVTDGRTVSFAAVAS